MSDNTRCGVVVEGHVAHDEVFREPSQFLLQQGSLTAARWACQQHRHPRLHQQLQEVAHAHCLSRMHQHRLTKATVSELHSQQ